MPSELTELSREDLVRSESFERASIARLDLADGDLTARQFAECAFSNVVLRKADLTASSFEQVSFEDCELSAVVLHGTRFADVTFRRCKLLGVNWTMIKRPLLANALRFEACQLDYSIFAEADLRGWSFHDSTIREADFSRADLRGCLFARTNLHGSRFSAAKLTGSDLRSAYRYEIDPRESDVAGMRVSLPEAASLLRTLGVSVEDGDQSPVSDEQS